MKKWEKPTVNELGLEKTKENNCPVNGARTFWPNPFTGCPWGEYKSINIAGQCQNFDPHADGRCKLNVSKIS